MRERQQAAAFQVLDEHLQRDSDSQLRRLDAAQQQNMRDLKRRQLLQRRDELKGLQRHAGSTNDEMERHRDELTQRQVSDFNWLLFTLFDCE